MRCCSSLRDQHCIDHGTYLFVHPCVGVTVLYIENYESSNIIFSSYYAYERFVCCKSVMQLEIDLPSTPSLTTQSLGLTIRIQRPQQSTQAWNRLGWR
ncbi:hypothetical protein EYC84_007064 [Monilinia fructicola]|uniref:Uncharacterized protein n=1 Tax=Monilinia fructicola TaxID=38448 RepID=A0A5M9K9G8_MONFR|nr:hypothetical protein EYC84_007064 [Monilinia fructicola]